MAHEIAHVAARHGTKQATRGEIANLATIPLIFVDGDGKKPKSDEDERPTLKRGPSN